MSKTPDFDECVDTILPTDLEQFLPHPLEEFRDLPLEEKRKRASQYLDPERLARFREAERLAELLSAHWDLFEPILLERLGPKIGKAILQAIEA